MTLRHPNQIDSARQARRSISLIRKKLLNPTPKSLESCAPQLRSAVDCLTRLQGQLAMPESESPFDCKGLVKEMSGLRRELRQVNALMRNASAFYAVISRLLAPEEDHPISYRASGLVAIPPASTMLLEG
jgi:hypothetical protein